MTTLPLCHPAANGQDPTRLEKRRTSTMESKVEAYIDEFCSKCPNRQAEFCESQGWWRNFDGNIVFLEGIFGGYTEAERKARGPRKFSEVEG